MEALYCGVFPLFIHLNTMKIPIQGQITLNKPLFKMEIFQSESFLFVYGTKQSDDAQESFLCKWIQIKSLILILIEILKASLYFSLALGVKFWAYYFLVFHSILHWDGIQPSAAPSRLTHEGFSSWKAYFFHDTQMIHGFQEVK